MKLGVVVWLVQHQVVLSGTSGSLAGHPSHIRLGFGSGRFNSLPLKLPSRRLEVNQHGVVWVPIPVHLSPLVGLRVVASVAVGLDVLRGTSKIGPGTGLLVACRLLHPARLIVLHQNGILVLWRLDEVRCALVTLHKLSFEEVVVDVVLCSVDVNGRSRLLLPSESFLVGLRDLAGS